MRTLNQILREFWLPFLLALAWTLLRTDRSNFKIADAVAAFAASFFLVSWASGQVVRVRKQQRVETAFADITTRIEGVADRLEASAIKIVGSVTGGDSFCRFIFNAGVAPNVLVSNEGEHPLYDVQARIVDLTILKALDVNSPRFPFEADTFSTIGDIAPGMAKVVPINLKSTVWTGLNVFFSARNGNWNQMLRRETSSGPISSRVRWSGDDAVLIEEKVVGVDESRFEHGW